MLDDTELLRRYVDESSESAFAELVARHFDLVYSAALRRVSGDAHRAHDVAQIVFLTLARKARSLARHPVLAGWLYNTTQNVARRAMRGEQRRFAREAEAYRMSQNERNFTADIKWEEVRPVLDDAMCELGERDRQAVILRFFARRPFAEIGHALGLSEDAARMRVERALEKLRLGLRRRGLGSTAAMLTTALVNQAVTAAPTGMAANVAASVIGAAGTTSVGSAAALLEFMSTSKLFLSGATLVVILVVGSAVYQAQASRAATDALAQAQNSRDRAQAVVRELEARAVKAEVATARLNSESDAMRSSQAAEKTRANNVPSKRRPSTEEGDAFMARHPDVKRLAIEGQRAQVAGAYAPLFKLLHLSPTEIERFKDLAIAGINGVLVGPEGEQIRYKIDGDRRESEAKIREMLGEDGFELYKTYYDTTGPSWQLTTQLAGDLYHTPNPLGAQQAEQLLQILVEGRRPTEWSTRPQFDWPTIMSRAQAILSADQVAALGDLSAHDKFSQAFTRAQVLGEIK